MSVAQITIGPEIKVMSEAVKLAGAVRTHWISAATARRLGRQGLPAGELERARNLRLPVSLMTDAVVTCEHPRRRA